MVRIGLLGCGNVGRIIATHINGFEVAALFDQIGEHAEKLSADTGIPYYTEFSDFITADYDICVEAASVMAVRQYALEVLTAKKDMLVLSVGAFANDTFKQQILGFAKENGRKIHIPTGAIFGVDNMKIGQISKLDQILLRTTKSPESLHMDVMERTLAFKGKANECIKLFPKNINVSVALSIASDNPVEVELYADPAVDKNIHEIWVKGEFGEVYTKVSNLPSPDNKSTSYLAALSVLSLLKNLDSPLVIGA